MAVNSNLMLVIVLLCVGYLQVASPKLHSHIRKAAEGKQSDSYKNIDNKYLRYYGYSPKGGIKTQSDCKKQCDTDNQCTTYHLEKKGLLTLCNLYRLPIISMTEEGKTFEECQKKCSETKGCRMVGQRCTGCYCFLYNIPYTAVPNNKIEAWTGAKLAEKEVCYKIIKYKLLGYSFMNDVSDVKTETECQQACGKNNQCSTYLYWKHLDTVCYLYPSPIILVTRRFRTFEECKKKCTETKDCKMASLHGAGGNCYFYNVTYSDIPNNRIGDFTVNGFTLAEQKDCE